jgi:hypothetical protein
MPSLPATRIRSSLAMGALLLTASIALVGCGAVATPTSPSEDTTAETPSSAEGYVYEDAEAGYAVTFPGEPSVEKLEINGTDRFANLVGYADEVSGMYYITRGEIRDLPIDLRNELLGWLSSVETESVGASSAELDGLAGVRAELSMSNGEAATTVMAADGDRFYQLIVMGGEAEDRDAFLDSFETLG